MTKRQLRIPLDFASIIGLPAAIAVVVFAHTIEGSAARSLWQPTAALVVFGGTFAALLLSYPLGTIVQTGLALWRVFAGSPMPVEDAVTRFTAYAQLLRRKGHSALETELERAPEQFLRSGLTLAADGTGSDVARQILEIESLARREAAERPADVLETAAGYTPTLGILGAVLGLIHTMSSLGEPARLGGGIAVAFIATVYGVAAANLVLLPLATKLRGRARQAALYREVVIEGVVALQEGLNPRLVEQKLYGYLTATNTSVRRKRAA